MKYTVRAFTSGELSPLMTARADLKRRNAGCSTLRNMIITPQGPTLRRAGTKFVADMTAIFDEDIVSYRLVDFVFDEETAYTLIFLTGTTKTNIYFAMEDGLVADPITPTLPYTVSTLFTTFNIQADQLDWAQSKDVLLLAQLHEVPLQLARLADDNWVLSAVVFTSPPAEWGAGDYPSKVAFYEQRLVYAANISYPQTLWFSVTADYFDFTTSAPLVDTDAITATIASGKHNKIQWLSSGSRLGVGTLGDEFTVSAVAGNPLSYATITVSRETDQGSEGLRPLKVNNYVIYLERLGRTVDEFVYDYNIGGYRSNDLSILSPHLTEQNPIVRWNYQKTPHSIIWCVRDDGVLIGCTYQREHEVIGWHPHMTDGEFLDVSCIPSPTTRETEARFLVKRTIEGVELIYLEKFEETFLDQDLEDAFLVDCGLEYNVPGSPISIVTGLDHLEGKTVSILADGSVRPSQPVYAGTITLAKAAEHIIVGLPFYSRAVPMPPEVIAADNSSWTRNQRATQMSVYLYRSLGLWYGSRDDNMEELPFRDISNNLGEAVPLFTGIKHINLPGGYDDEQTLILEQRQPLPMCILSITSEFEVYD